MLIRFPIATLWGEVVFQKYFPAINIPPQILSVFEKEIKMAQDSGSEPYIDASKLIDEAFLLDKKVTKGQANACVDFHNILNSIPLVKGSDGWISRDSRNQKGVFFPFSEIDLGENSENIQFYPLDWAATQESAEKWIEYLQEQGYLELGGNFGIEKIRYPILIAS